MSVLLYCHSLIDCTGREPMRDVAVCIEDGRIKSIGPREQGRATDSAQIIELGDMTMLPGIIDCHDHFCIDIGDEEAQGAEPAEYLAFVCAKNARNILRAGVTTVRSVGEKSLLGPMVRRAISEDIIQGPRVITSGRLIVRTGGHGWFLAHEADGPDGLRAAVREEVKRGVDLIKIMVSGGVSTSGSDVLAPELTDEEVYAVVDEAHRRGRKVAAHGHGGPGVAAAVRAGVDSIEHGIFLTQEDVDLMIEHGTYLVVTAGVFHEILHSPQVPAFMKAKLADAEAGFMRMLESTVGSGLKVALGTDENHGKVYYEMQILRRAGYTPMDALLAGTRNAADLCGLANDIGTLEPGKFADLIAVKGDPLADPGVLADVPFVMKGGKIEFDRRAG